MQVTTTAIPGLLLLHPPRTADERGFFAETFRRSWMEERGLPADWVQDNHSLSRQRGTVRGLHFQVPPRAQAKLVRVVAGSIFDVAVDLRRSSPTYGEHAAFELTGADGLQLLLPAGLAHGFCTLEDDTEVIYKVTDYYSAEHDRGLRWDDPALAIAWPIPAEEAILSARDCRHPALAELPDYFPEEA
ncbi:MAG: dTDP-4-dehydrorhamnose 3,5-epimerase [Actinobacteria bacterium]|nr:dTDP-4-dehydrorhamnose 3,5-epimerase [Actinomycetota bacterium]